MRFLPGRTLRSRDLRPRTPSGRRLRVVQFLVLGMSIAAVTFLMWPNFRVSRLQAEEVARKEEACVAVERYMLDKHAAPESLDDLVQAKYLSAVPINPFMHEKLSLRDCVVGPEDYMDPVQTTPGFRRLYSYSADTPGGGGAHSIE